MFLITSYELGHLDLDGFWRSGTNSAGLFGVQFQVVYQGDKVIKYCRIICLPKNAVGDFVACEIDGQIKANFKVTGPITSGSYTWTFENGWYNSTIDSVCCEKVELQYMDGSTETIPGEKLVEDLYLAIQQQEEQERQEKKEKEIAEEKWKKEHPVKNCLLKLLLIVLLLGFGVLLGGIWSAISSIFD